MESKLVYWILNFSGVIYTCGVVLGVAGLNIFYTCPALYGAEGCYNPAFFAIVIILELMINLFLFHYNNTRNQVNYWTVKSSSLLGDDEAERIAQFNVTIDPNEDIDSILAENSSRKNGPSGRLQITQEGVYRRELWIPSPESKKATKFCHECRKLTPRRCHHCPLCNICVLRKDHHCMLTGGCVGLANQRYFMVFLVWACIGASYGAVFTFRYLNQFVAPWYPFGWVKYVAPFAMFRWIMGEDTLFNFILALVFSAAIASAAASAGFFGAQMFYTLQGFTQHDYHVGRHRDEIECDGDNHEERLALVFGKRCLMSTALSQYNDVNCNPSTSLISNHNDADPAAKPSVKHHDGELKVHFDVKDGLNNAFVRDTQRSDGTGNLSRISLAIRKSLRLGPKKQTTAVSAGQRHRANDEARAPFTIYSDVHKEPCDMAYGTIGELQYMMQLNRKAQIKKFIRHNNWPVSHEIRSDLWRVLCNYKDFETNKLIYREQLNDLIKNGERFSLKSFQPAFLNSDGIVVHDHGLKQQGAVALQRVLIVIECVRPEIRFVPILYPLCAMLLHYMEADETFSTVMRFLGNGSTFLIQSDVSLYASFHTLLALVRKHRRSAYNFLRRRAGTNDDIKLAEVFAPWTAWIFKNLPFEYLVRVMDCYLVEGHKMLLRIGVSLVYLWYKQRVKSASTAAAGSTAETRIREIADQIGILAQNCPVSVQTLLDMGFAIRNFKHSTFQHLQKHYEDKFREDVHRRRLEKSAQTMVQTQRSMYTAAFESSIVDTDSACELMCSLPNRFQLETPILLFRLSEHGASFTQLWSQIDEAEQSLLIIRATTGEIFGAYCSACWAERRDVRERAKTRYFGTGESFVFKQPKGQLFPTVYQWVGRNNEHPDRCPQMFMTAGDKFLIIGSSGGDAIAIRDELSNGLSYPCETFGSTALVSNTSFEIDELEVFNVVSAGAA